MPERLSSRRRGVRHTCQVLARLAGKLVGQSQLPVLASDGTHPLSLAGAGWIVEAVDNDIQGTEQGTKRGSFTAYGACAKRTLLETNGVTYGSGSRVVDGSFDLLGNHNMRLVRTERQQAHLAGAKSFKQYYSDKARKESDRVCVPEEAIGT